MHGTAESLKKVIFPSILFETFNNLDSNLYFEIKLKCTFINSYDKNGMTYRPRKIIKAAQAVHDTRH